jgi:putative endonuclease
VSRAPRRPGPRQALGARGEALAAHWYVDRGFTVLDRNWRTRTGELDLVVGAPGIVVFCEVKTRTSDAYGTGAEAVTPTKQLRIRRLATEWLAAHPGVGGELRFDVASILLPRSGSPSVEVYEQAF